MAEIETSEVNVDAILDPQDIRVSIEDVIVIKGQDADIAAAEAATYAANEAATNANNAATNADTATMNANAAAANAASKAVEAENAANVANESATLANNAADNANNAAAQVTAQYAEDKHAWDAEVSAAAGEARAAGAEVKANYEQNVVSDYERRTAEWQSQLDKKATKDELAATINKQETTDLMQDKRIENLESAAKGILYREDVDTTEAYSKAVPAGAMPWASLDKVGGKTVVWNQLVSEYQNGRILGVLITPNADNTSVDIVGTLSSTPQYNQLAVTKKSIVFRRNGETKYLVTMSKAPGAPWGISGYREKATGSETSFMWTPPSSDTDWTGFVFLKASEGDTFNIQDLSMNVYNLTQMFGAGNEPSTVEEFRAMFPADYYPYNPGELMSAEVVEVESRGKNLCNIQIPEYTYVSYFEINTLEKAKELGNCIRLDAGEYVFSSKSTDQTMFKCFLDNGQIVTSGDTISGYYLGKMSSAQDWYDLTYQSYRWTIGDKVNMAVGLKIVLKEPCWLFICTSPGVGPMIDPQIERGTTATPYSPYGTKDTFPIPQSVLDICPGYGWSAGTVYNEIDFGRKKYVQRVGSVDLGTLNFSRYNEATDRYVWYARVNGSDESQAKAICALYEWKQWSDITKVFDKTMQWHPNLPIVYICDNSYTSSADFKAAMAGVQLYYELAEHIEVDLSNVLPDDNFIEVEAGGTVTFKQASTQLPVPSSVTYQVSTKEAIANA